MSSKAHPAPAALLVGGAVAGALTFLAPLRAAAAASCSPVVIWQQTPQTVNDQLAKEQPQLEMTSGTMSLTSDGRSLEIKVTVKNMNASQFASGYNGEEWRTDWTYGSTRYWASIIDSNGTTITYADGTVQGGDSTANSSPGFSWTSTTDTGKIVSGASGYALIDVPLSHFKNPGSGASLQQPLSLAGEDSGCAPTSTCGGENDVAQGGPQNAYTVCGATAAPPPATPRPFVPPPAPAVHTAPAMAPAGSDPGIAAAPGGASAADTPSATPFNPRGVAIAADPPSSPSIPMPPQWIYIAVAAGAVVGWTALRLVRGRG